MEKLSWPGFTRISLFSNSIYGSKGQEKEIDLRFRTWRDILRLMEERSQ